MAGFSGAPLRLIWLSKRTVLYIPDPDNPLSFTRPNGQRITLNKPFISDGATIPRIFWIFPWLDPWSWFPGALVHDYIWELRYGGRLLCGFWESNQIVAECCECLGVPPVKRWMIRWAINLFGWVWWLKGEATMQDVFNTPDSEQTKWMSSP